MFYVLRLRSSHHDKYWHQDVYGPTPGGMGGALCPRLAGDQDGPRFHRFFGGWRYPRPLVTVDACVQALCLLEVLAVDWVGHRA